MADKYYAEIFKHNGASYHQAMEDYPTARDEEFAAVLSLLALTENTQLLDIPAGGGYLRAYLEPSVNYHGLDFSSGFAVNDPIEKCTEDKLPVETGAFDTAVCLAGLHHVQHKVSLFKELHRSLKPNGILLIADVAQGSNEAHFLNGFVNQWNHLGHNGDFICFDRDTQLLREAGFSVESTIQSYCWNFASQANCLKYLRLLFALTNNPSDEVLNDAIAKLGTKQSNSGFHLNWSLGFMLAKAV